MKLQFNASLGYQQDAIQAVTDLFDGQPLAQSNFELSHTSGALGITQSEFGTGNQLDITQDEILKNVQHIQERNKIEQATDFQHGMNFSVEMETGTGKTYVYLRTIFELNKKYGFKKFIIVVPSIAIREGVLKSVEMTRQHFKNLYSNAPFDCFIYDSSRLSKVRNFASSNEIQIMIINIQSFQREGDSSTANVIHRELDKMSGSKPIEFIKSTNPFVIIDEPQSVDNTEKAKNALATLNPIVTLRYSATHRNPYNLLYRLDPIQAYDLRLVKRIEVFSLQPKNSFNDAYIKLLRVDNKYNKLRAQVEIHKKLASGDMKLNKIWVRFGDDLYVKSGWNELYRHGYRVNQIDCRPSEEFVEFSQGQRLELGDELGGVKDDIMKNQVRATVKEHLSKERKFKGKGIKVLSLFFIDRVANYRTYNDDGGTQLGKIGLWFEEAFNELKSKFKDLDVCQLDADEIHDGYFSQDKGRDKDTSGKTKKDGDTYTLIMRDKERLLDPHEPLRFIFSHSALREGWDNPNVFQVCTLNETQSTDKKRQEIGRGLRLPVNDQGERVRDDNINRLTVIANQSYEFFAQALQKEYENDYGIQFGKSRIDDASKKRQPIKLNKQVLLGDDFKQLWDKIKHRTRYRVKYDTDELIESSAKFIKNFMPEITQASLAFHSAAIELTEEGVASRVTGAKGMKLASQIVTLPDVLDHLQRDTNLTRDTLVKILKGSERLEDFQRNPQLFMKYVSREIKRALNHLMIDGIQYEKVANHYWDMKLFESENGDELIRYMKHLYKVQNEDKTIYDFVEFDSKVEREFAEDLDNHQNVKLFIKLPSWFKIDTPIGAYNPDWAFMTKDDSEKLYFVCETKGSADPDDRSAKENQKIECGKKHFDNFDVEYRVSKSLRDVLT